jgi:hypothetical protein
MDRLERELRQIDDPWTRNFFAELKRIADQEEVANG